MSIDINKMIARYGLISDQVDRRELGVILEELQRTLDADIPGAVVEFGCYRGTTSLYLRRVLDIVAPDRDFHVYDSFEGLPDKSSADSSPAGLHFVTGELSASKRELITEFKKAGLRPPVIHKAWFDALKPSDVPDEIGFAFLDGDYYDSVKASLKLIEAKLAPGAVIIVDDYANEALPGAARAVDEWLRNRNLRVRTVASLAVIESFS